ncbi:MAG: metallophosphoesterase [Acidobacteriota bacterium]|nr:metallophosphoesterase [Acidobacteriota bacterium]
MSLHRPRASHRPAFPACHLLAFVALLLAAAPCLIAAQQADPVTEPSPDATTPTLTFPQFKPGQSLHMVAYGDMRFTNPSRTTGTNPRVRKWLAARVAEGKPSVIMLTGDMPYFGARTADWDVYQTETAPWRSINALVLPTIGNHETYGGHQGIVNYMDAYPQIKGNRYYSAIVGNLEVISLDGTSMISPSSDQVVWFKNQLEHIPHQIDFLAILFHFPLVADWQSQVFARLPDKASILMRDILEAHVPHMRAKVVVFSGHIHNYERFERNGVEYVVTGGGGAEPYPILFRGSQDLYTDRGFPVYNYLTIDVVNRTFHAVMWKVKDPDAPSLSVEAKDQFTLTATPPGK